MTGNGCNGWHTFYCFSLKVTDVFVNNIATCYMTRISMAVCLLLYSNYKMHNKLNNNQSCDLPLSHYSVL